jgi:type I restriction enzyme S subunit
MIEYLVSKAKGATMLNINCKIVEDLPIPLPPLSLQQLFAQKIEAIEKQKALIKQSIAETEELFNSRMDYYFD